MQLCVGLAVSDSPTFSCATSTSQVRVMSGKLDKFGVKWSDIVYQWILCLPIILLLFFYISWLSFVPYQRKLLKKTLKKPIWTKLEADPCSWPKCPSLQWCAQLSHWKSSEARALLGNHLWPTVAKPHGPGSANRFSGSYNIQSICDCSLNFN